MLCTDIEKGKRERCMSCYRRWCVRGREYIIGCIRGCIKIYYGNRCVRMSVAFDDAT